MIAWLILALLLLATPAQAAVAVAISAQLLASTQITHTANEPIGATATITPGAGTEKVLVITINISQGCSTTAATVGNVTDDQAQSYTRLTQFKISDAVDACIASQFRGVQEVWYTIAPANAATTVTITPVDDPVGGPYRITFGGVVFTGTNQTTPVDGATSLYQLAGGSTISRTVTSAVGNMVSDIVCNGTAIPTIANGQNAEWNGGTDTNTNCASAVTGSVAGAASFSDTWNVNTGDSSTITAFNVASSGAAAATTLPARTLMGVGI